MPRGGQARSPGPTFPAGKPRSVAFSWERIRSGAIKPILQSELDTGYSGEQASKFVACFSPRSLPSLLKTGGRLPVLNEVDSPGSERLRDFRPNLCLDVSPRRVGNRGTAQGAGPRRQHAQALLKGNHNRPAHMPSVVGAERSWAPPPSLCPAATPRCHLPPLWRLTSVTFVPD